MLDKISLSFSFLIKQHISRESDAAKIVSILYRLIKYLYLLWLLNYENITKHKSAESAFLSAESAGNKFTPAHSKYQGHWDHRIHLSRT